MESSLPLSSRSLQVQQYPMKFIMVADSDLNFICLEAQWKNTVKLSIAPLAERMSMFIISPS